MLAHTTTLEHLRLILGDLRPGGSPLKSEEPLYGARSEGFEPPTF